MQLSQQHHSSTTIDTKLQDPTCCSALRAKIVLHLSSSLKLPWMRAVGVVQYHTTHQHQSTSSPRQRTSCWKSKLIPAVALLRPWLHPWFVDDKPRQTSPHTKYLSTMSPRTQIKFFRRRCLRLIPKDHLNRLTCDQPMICRVLYFTGTFLLAV
jgi:hypothetical protein